MGDNDANNTCWHKNSKSISQDTIWDNSHSKDAIIRHTTNQKFEHWLQEIRSELVRRGIGEYYINRAIGYIESLLFDGRF